MVNLSKIQSSKPERICAIDASTNSLAFAVFHGKELQYCGKINFTGKDTYEKLIEIFTDFDAIVIEHTIFINSPKTQADLALVQGAMLGAAAANGVKAISSVSPMTWQNFIGNKRLTKDEKFAVVKNNPEKSASWAKTQERELRKQRTIRFINVQYDKDIHDNDVADAVGIGHWAANA
jgi:hypothetical protein